MPDAGKKEKHTALYRITLITFYEYIPPYVLGGTSDFAIDEKLRNWIYYVTSRKWRCFSNLIWEKENILNFQLIWDSFFTLWREKKIAVLFYENFVNINKNYNKY